MKLILLFQLLQLFAIVNGAIGPKGKGPKGKGPKGKGPKGEGPKGKGPKGKGLCSELKY